MKTALNHIPKNRMAEDNRTNIKSKPKLLDQLRQALRSRHYSHRTEQSYCQWIKRYIYFHNVRHPKDMAEPEINAFLTYLAVKEKVSASTGVLSPRDGLRERAYADPHKTTS